MNRVAVFGTGYVGCVSAACLARDGHHVIGVDIDHDKVEAINAGDAPVSEPGLDKLLDQQVCEGRLSATTDLEMAVRSTDLAMITVGTPSGADGSVSTTAVEAVIRAIGEVLRECDHDYTIVVRSTLLPGILEERLAPLAVEASGREIGPRLQVCNNPEFLRESTAIADYDAPPFVVVGTLDGWHGEPVCDLYSGVPAETIVTDTRTAALLKYACNAYHATKVAFANEIGSLAHSFGADGLKVMKLVCQDTKLNVSKAYLRPGYAFGGSCLPKDVRALVRHAETEALKVELLGSLLPSNRSHLERSLSRVQSLGHRRIGLIGLSFKADTDDLRESPLVTFCETLLGRGYQIKIYDPDVRPMQLRGRNLAYVDQHLPHLADLLVEDLGELYDHAELLVLGNGVADRVDWSTSFQGEVFDLRTDLVRALPASQSSSGKGLRAVA